MLTHPVLISAFTLSVVRNTTRKSVTRTFDLDSFLSFVWKIMILQQNSDSRIGRKVRRLAEPKTSAPLFTDNVELRGNHVCSPNYGLTIWKPMHE